MPLSVPVVLLKMSLQECVNPEDSNMEELRNAIPIPGLSELWGS